MASKKDAIVLGIWFSLLSLVCIGEELTLDDLFVVSLGLNLAVLMSGYVFYLVTLETSAIAKGLYQRATVVMFIQHVLFLSTFFYGIESYMATVMIVSLIAMTAIALVINFGLAAYQTITSRRKRKAVCAV